MTFRHIGKFTIAIGGFSYRETREYMKELYDKFIELGIKCDLYLDRRLIVTDNVIMKFILQTDHYRFSKDIYGVRCDGCYNFADDIASYITKGDNKCEGYELIDYIKMGENI